LKTRPISIIPALGIIGLLVLLIAQPVTAWHAEVTLAGPEGPVCSTSDFYSYTILVNSAQWPEHILRVIDSLPAGLEYIPGSSTTQPGAGVDPQWDASTRTLIWDFTDIPKNTERSITFKVKPAGLHTVTNTAETRVMPLTNWENEKWGHVVSNTVTTTFSDDVCPVPTPEFPTIALPAGLLAGFLGVVLLVRRTREI
jgi:hypothetical protein